MIIANAAWSGIPIGRCCGSGAVTHQPAGQWAQQALAKPWWLHKRRHASTSSSFYWCGHFGPCRTTPSHCRSDRTRSCSRWYLLPHITKVPQPKVCLVLPAESSLGANHLNWLTPVSVCKMSLRVLFKCILWYVAEWHAHPAGPLSCPWQTEQP